VGGRGRGSQIINPQAAESMGYGGVVDGLSQMAQELRWTGSCSRRISSDPLIRMRQTPPIECTGEDGLFADRLGERRCRDFAGGGECDLCGYGKRVRTLPLARSGFSWLEAAS